VTAGLVSTALLGGCGELDAVPPESNCDFNAPKFVFEKVFARFILLVGEGEALDATFGDPEGDSNIDILSDIGFCCLRVKLAMIILLFLCF